MSINFAKLIDEPLNDLVYTYGFPAYDSEGELRPIEQYTDCCRYGWHPIDWLASTLEYKSQYVAINSRCDNKAIDLTPLRNLFGIPLTDEKVEGLRIFAFIDFRHYYRSLPEFKRMLLPKWLEFMLADKPLGLCPNYDEFITTMSLQIMQRRSQLV